VSGDFNHDGKPDVAVANQGDNTLGVLLNSPTTQTGNPSFFQLKGNFGTGNGPDSIATGDFNGDGNTDFVVGAQDGRLAVILGRGDGSIQSDNLIKVSGEVAGVAVADFNHDGKPDIAEVNGDGTNTVDVLLGNGNGTFQAPLVFRANSAGSDGLAVGDFNGDGRPDLVVSNSSGGDVTVLLNDGTWPAPPPPSGGGGGGAATAVAAPVVPAAEAIGTLAPTADGADAAAPWAPATARHRAAGFGRLG
jgi:hypothetical protein